MIRLVKDHVARDAGGDYQAKGKGNAIGHGVGSDTGLRTISL